MIQTSLEANTLWTETNRCAEGGLHSPVRMASGKFPQLEYGFGLKGNESCGSRWLCCTKGTWEQQKPQWASNSASEVCVNKGCVSPDCPTAPSA